MLRMAGSISRCECRQKETAKRILLGQWCQQNSKRANHLRVPLRKRLEYRELRTRGHGGSRFRSNRWRGQPSTKTRRDIIPTLEWAAIDVNTLIILSLHTVSLCLD
jgi:hypothetical protein